MKHRSLSAQNQDLRAHLRVLELQTLPDEKGLKRQFKQLLVSYHPDRNSHRSEWAHEKTLELLSSHKELREYLKKFPAGRMQPRFGASVHSGGRTSRSTHKTVREREGTLYQLIDCPHHCYALPVRYIVTILGAKDALLDAPGGKYVSYNKRMYPAIALSGDASDEEKIEFLVLFHAMGRRSAIMLPEGVTFSEIRRYQDREIAYMSSQIQQRRGWVLYHGRRAYLFPEILLNGSKIEV